MLTCPGCLPDVASDVVFRVCASVTISLLKSHFQSFEGSGLSVGQVALCISVLLLSREVLHRLIDHQIQQQQQNL